MISQRLIQMGFTTSQPVSNSKFLPQFNEILNMLLSDFNVSSHYATCSSTYKYIIISVFHSYYPLPTTSLKWFFKDRDYMLLGFHPSPHTSPPFQISFWKLHSRKLQLYYFGIPPQNTLLKTTFLKISGHVTIWW